MEKQKILDQLTGDEDFVAPCLAAQQFIGILFGIVLGYCSMLLCSNRIVISLCTGGGVVFGLLGSRVPSPLQIKMNEFIKVSICVVPISLFYRSLCIFDLLGVVLISLLDTLIASMVIFGFSQADAYLSPAAFQKKTESFSAV